MSTSRIGGWLAAVALIGGLAVVGGYTWEGWDGRRADRSDPRLVAEGTGWSVVQVHEREWGDCLYLRQDGATVERACSASKVLLRYEVSVHALRDGPVVFGVLPDGATRAEVAADGGDTAERFRKAPLVALQVRSYGDGGRFVAEPAPPGPGWQDRTRVTVELP